MYGTNAPKGFVPVRHENGSSWNGQLNSDYRIPNGYNYNIGIGELVYITNGVANGGNAMAGGASIPSGYLQAWSQLSWNGSGTPVNKTVAEQVTVVGVFMGCQYPNNNTFPIAGPLGHLSWVGSTLTQDGSDPVAYIITDPTVVYTAQCNANTTGFTMVTANQLFYGTFYNAGVALFNPSVAPGGTLNSDGSCCQGIDLNTGEIPPFSPDFGVRMPIRTICLDPSPNNISGAAFNNAYCMIQNGQMFQGAYQGAHP